MSGKGIEWVIRPPNPAALALGIKPARAKVQGLFSGGTLCAEAQVFFRRAGLPTASNVPIPGVDTAGVGVRDDTHVLLDLGEDEYTLGRPHPMIDPSHRNQMVADALNDGKTGVILLDLVIGYGATPNPAGELLALLPAAARNCLLICSICGTEGDPQRYSWQLQQLDDAGIIVAPSNAHAAELAISVVRSASGERGEA
jgi:FdrA protein